MLIAMAGLPGTGKSTIARVLAERLCGTVLDKDEIRFALFGDRWTEYSLEQDDFTLGIMLQTAERLIARQSCPAVVLDGRTFSKKYQLDRVRAVAAETPLHIVECICPEVVALDRIRATKHLHRARNRDEGLYWRVRDAFETIPQPKLMANTIDPIESTVQRLIEKIAPPPSPPHLSDQR